MKIFRVASAQPAVQYEQCLLLYLLKLGLIAIVSVLLSPSASVTSCASLNHFFQADIIAGLYAVSSTHCHAREIVKAVV